MKKFFVIPCVCLMLFGLSCSREAEVPQQVISVNADNPKKCDDIISSIEILPLDTAREAYMSSVSRCVIDDEHSFFVDNRGIIFLFDKAGRIVANSQNVYGQGKGEYNVCLCASYNRFSKCFEVVTPLGMNIYNRGFKYIKTVHFPAKNEGVDNNCSFFKYIYDIGADRHLLMTSNIAPDPAHIFIYNSRTEKVESDAAATSKPFGITMQDNCISDSCFLAMPWLDYNLYKIDLETARLADCIKFDFGGNEIKKEDVASMGNDEAKKAKFFMTCTKPLPVRTFKSGDKLVSMLKCGSRRSDFKLLLADITSGKSAVVDMVGNKFSLPFVENFVGNTIFCHATDVDIDKHVNVDLLDSKSARLMKTMPKNGNMIVLKYHIKTTTER